MIADPVTTITLTAGTPQSVKFASSYPFYWIDNKTSGNVYARIGGTPAPDSDGTFTIAAGSQLRVSGGAFDNDITLLGSGKVQIIASELASCPFKLGAKGGGNELSGASSYSVDAVDYPLLGFSLYGKSTQDGTPSPDAPVDIVSIGDSGSIDVKACSKNLFDLSKCDWKTKELNGLSFTRSDNGEILVNGTATAATTVIFTSYGMQGKITSGQLILSGCPQTGVDGSVCRLQFYYISPTLGSKQLWQANAKEIPITLPYDYTGYNCSIFINAGFTANNLVFKPMLRSATITDSTFEPYKGNTANITSTLPLYGIPVESGGNYTDSTGQQWVCDTLVYNADGSGKIKKYINDIIFNGSEDWKLTSNVNHIYLTVAANLKPKYVSNATKAYLFANKYAAISVNDIISLTKSSMTVDPNGNFIIRDERFVNNVAGLKADMAANNLRVVYALATPFEIELTSAEVDALRTLQTFNGTTSISNSANAEMSVKYCTNKALSEYVLPITNGLQAQIDELRAAVLSMGGNV